MNEATRPARPATSTLNLRNFPVKLKVALRRIQLERELEQPPRVCTLTDLVVEGLTSWLEQSGQLPAE